MPRHKNHVFSIQTLKQSIFLPPNKTHLNSDPLKSSLVCSPHWNQVNFDNPHKNLVKKIHSPTSKLCKFRPITEKKLISMPTQIQVNLDSSTQENMLIST